MSCVLSIDVVANRSFGQFVTLTWYQSLTAASCCHTCTYISKQSM